MAVALVEAPAIWASCAQLRRAQRAVGDGDAQHIGVELQIEAVHQPQRLELVLGQLAGEAAAHLVAKLRDPLGEEALIEGVIAIHGRRSRSDRRAEGADALAQARRRISPWATEASMR